MRGREAIGCYMRRFPACPACTTTLKQLWEVLYRKEVNSRFALWLKEAQRLPVQMRSHRLAEWNPLLLEPSAARVQSLSRALRGLERRGLIKRIVCSDGHDHWTTKWHRHTAYAAKERPGAAKGLRDRPFVFGWLT